ncbi:hypothetical protein EV361DRAFT_557702 [Lentinula raphanica]|nr:hypothetical protein EV361DRAFT_557702 [Lentinula raphanica]
MPRKPSTRKRRTYSRDLKLAVVHQLFVLGYKTTKVAIELSVPLRLVQRIQQNWKEIRDVCKERKGIGRAPLMTPDSCKLMFGLIERSPDIYLDEIQDEMYYAYGLTISISTIWRTLRRLGISNKRVCISCFSLVLYSEMFFLSFPRQLLSVVKRLG